ncbi:unnamed protein product [Clavelina lepadiformis]|uniref:Uncharacterized protein n=1 Tax=Clavelina lepadiformis TaxID=159417 RepID=A0ABP0FDI0_CLALP
MSCSVYLNHQHTNFFNPRTADFQMIDASNLKQLKIWTSFAGKFCSKTELFLDLGPEMAPDKKWYGVDTPLQMPTIEVKLPTATLPLVTWQNVCATSRWLQDVSFQNIILFQPSFKKY